MAADAVVIGAGHNGLVAANLLADRGWEVEVLEAADAAGGAVRSGELAPGFRADRCSAFYPFAACSPVLRALGLDDEGLRWRHAPTVLAHPLPDGRCAILSRDLEQTAESVETFAPGDGERWRTAYRQWRRLSEPILSAIFTPFPPVRPLAAILRQVGTAEAIRLARRLVLSARELGDDLFAGDGGKLLLTGCARHSDVAPEAAGSGVYGWLLTMLGQQYGFPAPAGGAQAITDALVRRLASRGGRVTCAATATRVVIRRGTALGVITSDGRAYRARRAVLASVPAPVLYRDLVGFEQLPSRLVDDLAGFRYGRPTLKIDWALAQPLSWLDQRVSGAGTVHLGGGLAELSASAAVLAAGEMPAHPLVLVGQMTTTDPARSPAGTQTLWAYTHLPGGYAGLARDEPRTAALVDQIEALIDQHAPGFRALVRGRLVQGPADLERENPALVGGAVGAGTSAPGQQLIFRPVPGLGRADTPIDRLFLAGASAHPGPGVHGGPGANAARAALHAAAPLTGAAYRIAVRGAHRVVY